MEQVKITVIIPVFNMEKYLQECLDSVVSQSLHDIEILCINDGSTDNSPNILSKMSMIDSRITVINQENQGVASTRNRGIREAQGEYVMFMDPDDYYPTSDILEALYNTVKTNNVMVAGGEFSEINPEGIVIEPDTYEDNPFLFGYRFEKEGILEYSDYQFDYGYHRFIYNKNFLIENNLFFPLLARFQDSPFFVKTLAAAKSFYAIKKITYRYRLGDDAAKYNWPDKKYLI